MKKGSSKNSKHEINKYIIKWNKLYNIYKLYILSINYEINYNEKRTLDKFTTKLPL